MMLREPEQPIPIKRMPESFMDPGGGLFTRFRVAACQDQIEFRAENGSAGRV